MSANDDLLDRIQRDTYETLLGVPGLALAKILLDDEGDIEARVVKSLATLDATSGKYGLAVIVLLPEVEAAERNLPGPPLRVKVEIQVLEQVLFNRQPEKGTGIRSSVAALRVLGALHLRTLGPHALYAEKNPIQPLRVKPGHVAHVVTLWARADGISGPARPAPVEAEWTAGPGTLALSCATPASAIHYTTNLSLPRPGAPGSTLYTAPIAGLQAGTVVRAAAYVTNLNPGDVTELVVTD